MLSSKYFPQVSKDAVVEVDSRFGQYKLPVDSLVPQVNKDTSMFKLRLSLPAEVWFDNETVRVNIISGKSLQTQLNNP